MRTTRMTVGAIVAAGCVVSCAPRPGLTGSGERMLGPEPSGQPTSGSGSGAPQSPAPLATEQPVPKRPGSPCSTLFPNLAPARAFPSDKDVGAMTLEGSPNGGTTEAEIREALRATQPMDPCDSSIPPWQYGPAGGARFAVAGAGAFHMSLFLGGRGILQFPDGAQIMFDWGDPSYAHCFTTQRTTAT